LEPRWTTAPFEISGDVWRIDSRELVPFEVSFRAGADGLLAFEVSLGDPRSEGPRIQVRK
jgi:hypothetical protein